MGELKTADDGFKVKDIELRKLDETGSEITWVYAKNSPDYATYRTDSRVAIQYADDGTLETRQRAGLAALAPLRGQINGLINGWRTSDRPSDVAKAKRYDRNVADALEVAMTNDVANAQLLLMGIRDSLSADRTSRARLIYLLYAGGSVLAIVVLTALLSHILGGALADARLQTDPLWIGAGAGALGALFSVAFRVNQRQLTPENISRDNAVDATVRIVLGSIAAVVLVALFEADLVSAKLGGIDFGQMTGNGAGLKLALLGFIGGFGERLVPDLLAGVSLGSRLVAGAAPTPIKGPAGSADPGANTTQGGDSKPVDNRQSSVTQGAGRQTTRAVDQPGETPRGAQDAALSEGDGAACAADLPLAPAEVVSDDQLPPASGGVAGT